MRKLFHWIVIFLLLLCCVGCSLVRLQEDVNASYEYAAICGRIDVKAEAKGFIVVAAQEIGLDGGIFDYTVVHESGEYELGLKKGKYRIFAFCDINGNLRFDNGEPAGQYIGGEVVVTRVGVIYDIDISIERQGIVAWLLTGTKVGEVTGKIYSRQAGAITDLDDERFNEENGVNGFWQPMSFFKDIGGNIHFLEKYDPSKIPVLFIHGATGTPRGWRPFIENLDRTRFQPWLYYYPSGVRLNTSAYLLLWKLVNLQSKYQFSKMYVVAHSMGGLVARSLLVNYGNKFPFIKLFIAVATPWGGDKIAEYGVKQSPFVIPSWIDMQPDGDFIESLYRIKLPENVTFYMFSGHRGSRNPFSSNNDGTISLSSLLDQRSQAEAKMNYVFDEGHDSLLNSKGVMHKFNGILNDFSIAGEGQVSKEGYLKVNISYAYELDGVRPSPILLLRSSKEKAAEIVVSLNNSSENILGPFPPGEYLASVVTHAAKSNVKFAPVTIADKKTSQVDFVFSADGVIRGCLASQINPEDKVTGMPDSSYRKADKNLYIQSIHLQGQEIDRKLPSMVGEDVNDYDWAIYRYDISYNNCFAFFNLPAGKYNVEMEIEGYGALVREYNVKPGKPRYYRVTELNEN